MESSIGKEVSETDTKGQRTASKSESVDTRCTRHSKTKNAKGMQKQHRQDQSVMGTNDSSIVSKRSVERIYHSGPHLYRYFVEKPKKRSPLINRGYWFRMYSIETVVRRFLQETTAKRRVVLNLGCGYDALPFQLLTSDGRLCQSATFVDVDYSSLMKKKVKIVSETEALRSVLGSISSQITAPEVLLRSEQYIALGCDLREIERMQHLLNAELELSNCSFLILAEVSITYMDTVAADALVAFAAKLGDVRFCLLEQYLPAGLEHPFAQRMTSHFKALNTPLRSIETYPTLEDQEQRFYKLGWTSVTARSLWDLWNDDRFISSSTRISLQTVEPFDEWEEFALFASHYFLLIASSTVKPGTAINLIDACTLKHTNFVHNHKCAQSVSDLVLADAVQSSVTASDFPKGQREARAYGVLFQSEDNVFCHHGGYSGQGRLKSSDIYLTKNSAHSFSRAPPLAMEARMCHTVTTIPLNACPSNFNSLIVGGRSAPDHALSDCWYRQGDLWERVEDLPRPLYRHCACRVQDHHGRAAVLVYGGRSTGGVVSSDWLLWRNVSGWTEVKCNENRLTSRFAASFSSDGIKKGILLGGLSADGTILPEFWEWSINITAESSSVDITPKFAESFESPEDLRIMGRFGASLAGDLTYTYIVGGISRLGVLPHLHDIVRICHGGTLTYKPVAVAYPKWSSRVLVGHNSIWDRDSLVVVGGGAVCFSFGYQAHIGSCRILIRKPSHSSTIPYYLSGYPHSLINGSGNLADHEPWCLLNQPQILGQNESPPSTKTDLSTNGHDEKLGASTSSRSLRLVRRERFSTSDRLKVPFKQLVNKMEPVVIEGQSIGACCSTWSTEYLKLRIGADREVTVHQSESRAMNFQEKNFRYVRKPFGEFIDDIVNGKLQYLRSLSESDPVNLTANFASDFASISKDFTLPPPLQLVTENFHSSVLRISGPVAMWLHYDVMANVLCQVRGSKRLLLYPPSDIVHLKIPHGESSSSIDVFNTSSAPSHLEGTHPQEVLLGPGDILYIPPLWAHAASPTDTTSVSVNVFFRNLKSGYAAGRDVYGNRDVQAYEDGRRDIQRIAKRFANVPPTMARFYLERIGNELEDLMPNHE